MQKLERVVGNTIAIILFVIVVLSVLHSFFNFVFRDARGVTMYGSRGEFYMVE